MTDANEIYKDIMSQIKGSVGYTAIDMIDLIGTPNTTEGVAIARDMLMSVERNIRIVERVGDKMLEDMVGGKLDNQIERASGCFELLAEIIRAYQKMKSATVELIERYYGHIADMN